MQDDSVAVALLSAKVRPGATPSMCCVRQFMTCRNTVHLAVCYVALHLQVMLIQAPHCLEECVEKSTELAVDQGQEDS